VDISQEAKQMLSRRALRRFFMSSVDTSLIGDLNRKLNEARERFQVILTLSFAGFYSQLVIVAFFRLPALLVLK
jgi:hypothetical protein